MATFNLNGIDFSGISTDRDRLADLCVWLGEIVKERPLRLTVASADASFRSYYRACTESLSFVVMDAPPPAEDTRPFHALAQSLFEAGVAVPRVYGWAADPGFMLLEDFGNTTLLSSLGERQDGDALNSKARRNYTRALDALVDMQDRTSSATLPKYDGAFLLKEMDLFRHWLVNRHLNLSWSLDDEQQWRRTTHQLVADALAQPRVFVHRDFHSRNLMVRDEAPLGILDFQDAMHGPVFYDVVSLLKDCYVTLSKTQRRDLFEYYLERAAMAGIKLGDSERNLSQFQAIGIQRHLKAAGIFARLWHRDAKNGYLNDIPRTLRYIVEAGKESVDYAWLSKWIEQRVLPKLSGLEKVT